MRDHSSKPQYAHWRHRFSQEWAGVLMLLFVLFAIGVITVAHGNAGPAQNASAMSTTAGSELWMDGTSTLHDWECRTSHVKLELMRANRHIEPASSAAFESLIRGHAFDGLEVAIPVRAFRAVSKGFEKKMLKALQSDRCPEIHFHMQRYAVTSAAQADTLAIRMEGVLTVSGVAKDVRIAARAYTGEGGEWFEGSEALMMSEFGLDDSRSLNPFEPPKEVGVADTGMRLNWDGAFTLQFQAHHHTNSATPNVIAEVNQNPLIGSRVGSPYFDVPPNTTSTVRAQAWNSDIQPGFPERSPRMS